MTDYLTSPYHKHLQAICVQYPVPCLLLSRLIRINMLNELMCVFLIFSSKKKIGASTVYILQYMNK